MKRLYVKPDYHGKVFGRTLVEKIVRLDIDINLIKKVACHLEHYAKRNGIV